MKKRVWTLATACAVVLLAFPFHGVAQPPADKDEFVRSVVLIKEGVRAPSESEVRLQRLDKEHTWTDWPVGAGRVT
ncbi:MAG: hypothetical protein K6E40_06470, partial [Desulfovibrio sp.]|nr:hypothetical protein [Desulfovibrio sp.]